MRERCDAVVRWGLLALVVFTPFAFGTVERWSIALMEWGIAILLLVFLLGRLWDGRRTGERASLRTGIEVPLLLAVALVAFQLLPLPAPALKVLSPGSALIYSVPDLGQEITGLGGPAEAVDSSRLRALQGPTSRPVSISPDDTYDHLLLLLSLIVLYYLTVGWCDRRERAVWLAGILTLVASLVAVVGLLQSFTWNERLLWFRRAPSTAYTFGPFVNHNHFAGYVEMIIPLAIGLGLFLLEGRRRSEPDPARPAGVPSGFAPGDGGGAWSRASSQAGLALFGAVILVVSLFFSLSRGGILSALLSGSVLLGLFWRRLRSRRVAWALVLGLPAVVAVIMFWIGAGIVRERFETAAGIENEASFRSRAQVWSSIVHHLPQFIWVGSGLGSFEDSFAAYTPPGSATRWDKAHNDYLQAAWEVGLAGVTLLGLTVALFVWRYGWPALANRGQPLDLLRTGIALGLLSIALHSVVDFSLQIGANGALFALLAAMLVALTRIAEQSGTRREAAMAHDGD